MKRTPLKRTTPLKRSSRLTSHTPVKKVNRERMDRRTKEYKHYMASEAWAGRRLNALIAADWTCQRCGHAPLLARYGEAPSAVSDLIAARPLHVHHRTYARFGNERPSDLEVLCDSCHNAEHAGRFIQPRHRRAG